FNIHYSVHSFLAIPTPPKLSLFPYTTLFRSIQVANPEKEGEFKWEAYQTYDDGETVEWTGAKDSDKPAPVTKVVEGDGATEESNQSENGPIVLWIISIAAIIISIVAIFKKTYK